MNGEYWTVFDDYCASIGVRVSYLVFAWTASILYGLEVIIAKLLSRYSIKNPWLFNFFWSFFIVIFTLPVSLRMGVGWPLSWDNLLLAGLFYALSGIFFILALFALDVSVLSPLFNFRTVVSLVLAFFFFGEVITGFQVFLVTLILVAGVLVTLDEKWSLKSFFSLGVGVALLAMLFLSLMAIYIKKAIAENGYWEVSLFMPLIAQAFLLLTLPKFWQEVRLLSLSNILFMSLTGLASFAATLAVNKAYGENVGLSTVIISLPLSLVMAFALSLVVPRMLEHHPPRVYVIRFAAAAVMIIAAIKLSLWV